MNVSDGSDAATVNYAPTLGEGDDKAATDGWFWRQIHLKSFLIASTLGSGVNGYARVGNKREMDPNNSNHLVFSEASMTTTPTNPETEASPRLSALQRAAAQWKRQLVDATRSPLLYYRDLKTGTLDLTPGGDDSHVNGSAVNSLLAGRSVRLSMLIPGNALIGADSLEEARGRLKRISLVAQTYLEEKGASTLFLAAGLATWDAAAGACPNAPVILLPLSVAPEDAAHREFILKVSGDAHVNPVMAHSLRTDYGVDLSEDDFDLEEPPDSLAGMQELLNRVSSSLPQVPGFGVTLRLVVGNFRYNNLPLVTDLEQNLESFASNDLVAAIAGVPEAKESLAPEVDGPSPDLPDTEPPEAEFLVLDADSSQHQAINRALMGQSEVVWGSTRDRQVPDHSQSHSCADCQFQEGTVRGAETGGGGGGNQPPEPGRARGSGYGLPRWVQVPAGVFQRLGGGHSADPVHAGGKILRSASGSFPEQAGAGGPCGDDACPAGAMGYQRL